MANYISFGDTIPTPISRYTQYILEFRVKKISILEPTNNDFNKYNIDDPRLNSLKYNKYRCSSFVISTDINSFYYDGEVFTNTMLTLFTVDGYKASVDELKDLLIYHNLEFLGVVEHNASKGWHLHLLVFYRDNYENEKELLEVQSKIWKLLVQLGQNNEQGDTIFVNCQLVKSIGSMINYVKKDPHYVISSALELIQMYVHFEREHIFPVGSLPKFTNKNNHTLPTSTIIEFFKRKLKNGCIDFEQALQDEYATNFLGNRNLKELFENARTHYLSNRKFIHSIEEIINKFIKKDQWFKKCICPIVEYLNIQCIDCDRFEENFCTWLKCSTKKNTLALIGPADTGKSIFLSTLHNNFRFANRLTTDGIFTFANTINADVCYHEEPFITPETCEVGKLVYEGNPNSTIAVKNRGCQRLNKKIPILVTANTDVYKYCSGQKNAFDARMFIYKPNYKLSSITFCDEQSDFQHRCLPLNTDIQRRAYKELHGDAGEPDQWERNYSKTTSEDNQLSGTETINSDCSIIHKLRKHHWRTYIIYIIYKYQLKEYLQFIPIHRNSDFDIRDLHSIKTFMKHCNCHCYQFVK